jgi:hypothetical protein
MSSSDESRTTLFNFSTLAGFVLSATAAGLIIVLLVTEMITRSESPYIGLLTYFALPALLTVGLLLVAHGITRARRAAKRTAREPLPRFPVLNLNDHEQRKRFVFFVSSTIFFVIVISIVAVKGYEFSESPTFCGNVCHTVMEPEHTAWSRSPHARVRCVDCHVGPGAEHFVKAKLAGLRQVWAVVTNSYSRPIQVPIGNLRPARETCEECHWSNKTYYEKTVVFRHYAPNERNTPRSTRMILKIGGEAPPPGGWIHWHIGKDISYLTTDPKRQEIPYVELRGKDGKVIEFLSDKVAPGKEIKGERRRMDCIDCHNRPTHIFRSPSREIDKEFVAGRLDPSLPYIKKVALDVLSQTYASREEGMTAIGHGIQTYYNNYPGGAAVSQAAIKRAAEDIQYVYRKNFFPKMKVDWRTYPDNIGHFYFRGCFRCHDGKHRSRDGHTISRDCDLCHVVVGQTQENIPAGMEVRRFVHPVDIGDALYTTDCTECHLPGKPG